jgi:acyl-coenzyme A thioesterase PaaI-like protein
MHAHSLTSSVLRGPSLLAVPPLAFVKNDESQAVLILHLGRSLCGHDGIIHGGMIATVFDESLARNVSRLGVRKEGMRFQELMGSYFFEYRRY